MLSNLTFRRPIYLLSSFKVWQVSTYLTNFKCTPSWQTQSLRQVYYHPSFVWKKTNVYHIVITPLHWYNASVSFNSVLTARQFISLPSSTFPLRLFIYSLAVCLQVSHLSLWLLSPFSSINQNRPQSRTVLFNPSFFSASRLLSTFKIIKGFRLGMMLN